VTCFTRHAVGSAAALNRAYPWEGPCNLAGLKTWGATMTTEFWLIVCAAAIASAALAWWATRHSMLRDFDKRLKFTAAKVNEQNAATNEKLRAAHKKAKLELDQLSATVPAKVAAAVSAEKAATARLQSSLDIAYAELDRLRPRPDGKQAVKRDPAHAFAATEMMENQR
jgi:hypothetical protein